MADMWQRRFRADYRVVRVSRSTGDELGRVGNVTGGSITRNQDTSTYESASLDYVGSLDVGADLLRVYLDATDEVTGEAATVALGTFLPSTPKREVEGSRSGGTADLYGRLRELADDDFDEVLRIDAGANAVAKAAEIVRGCGLEVVADASDYVTSAAWTFGAGGSGKDTADTKLAAVNELLGAAGFSAARTDPMGRVLLTRYVAPSAKPVARSFAEGPGCTVLSSLTDELDRLSISNVVHVDYTTQEATVRGTAVDDDPMSEWSTASVGRRIVKLYSYSDLPEGTTSAEAQAAANLKALQLLNEDRSVLRRVSFTTPYCPVTVGDAVRLELPTAGLSRTYVVRKQDISLGPACQVAHEARNFDK